MTDSIPVRGPDFLPYPLPDRTVVPATPVVPAPLAPTPNRWRAALQALTPWGRATLAAAGVAVGSLLLVSLLADRREVGAWLSCSAGLVGLLAGLQALKETQPADTAAIVKGGIGTGVVSAAIALLLVLTQHDAIAEQPPVQVPSPAPTSAQPQQPTPTPATPAPGPTAGTLPPGSQDLFGIPTEPGQPLTQPSTDRGTLTGRVVTTSGAALPGATVTVTRAVPGDTSDSPACPTTVITSTDSKGNYRLELCQLGDQLGYRVVIRSGTASAMTDLFVNSGQTTVYNVILAVRHA